MKKIIMFLLVGIIVLSAVACTTANEEVNVPEITGTLEEIMEQLYEGMAESKPNTVITVVTDENMKYYLGTADVEFAEAIASEPMISSIAHSVVILRVTEGTDIEDVKTKIKENVDGRKWICVGVEEDEIVVDSIGNLVVLIMDKDYETIHQNFINLAK